MSVIKSIFSELFSSNEMAEYLSENISSLHKFQITDMISGASVSLRRKKEMFESLSECNEPKECNDFSLHFSFSEYAEHIDRAIKEFETYSEKTVFLMQICYNDDNDYHTVETVPFKTPEKALAYMKENYDEDNWCRIEKWETYGDEMKQTYSFIVKNGEVIFYDNETDRDDEVWPDPDLNLPIPFKAGDIIKVSDMPFHPEKKALILETGDNTDCCSVWILYVSYDGTIDENALKHGHILGDYSTMATSPLYNIERYEGEPEEEDKVLFEIQNYMKKNNISYYENQDAFYSLVNKKVSDITEETLNLMGIK